MSPASRVMRSPRSSVALAWIAEHGAELAGLMWGLGCLVALIVEIDGNSLARSLLLSFPR